MPGDGPGTTSLDALTDGSLARAVAGTETVEAAAAESELYRRFAPRVRLYGLKHLRDRAAADDLAQQVMLIVIERLRAGEIRDPDQVASFVLGTSRMVAVGLRRTSSPGAAPWPRIRAAGTWCRSTNRVDVVRIGPCLAAIRERERTILLLSFYAEKSAGEIAESLGMTPGAVSGRHRALASMRTPRDRRPA